MKLIACHVENFGKLSDFSMDFQDGLNIINEPNSWGKSTLAAFLKAMFYGLDSKKDPRSFDRERNIYRPWQGGIFGGEVDFEVNGKKYRINRIFGKTEKTDQFHLYDLSTKLECHDYSSDIGVELFDLDSNSFKRTVFIMQNDCESTATDSINAKLGNLAESTNDINNFESACNALKDLLNHMSPNRATGSIKRRKQLIEQISLELRGYEAAEEGYEKIRALQEEKLVEKDQLTTKRKQYVTALHRTSKESLRKEKKRQYDVLCQDVKQEGENCKQYQNRFPAGVPKEEDIRRFTGTVRQLAEIEASIRNMREDEEKDESLARVSELFKDGVPEREEWEAHMQTQKKLTTEHEKLAQLESKERYMKEMDEQIDETLILEEKDSARRKAGGFHLVGVVFLIMGFLVLGASVAIQVFMQDYQMADMASIVWGIVAIVFFILSVVLFVYGGRQKAGMRLQERALEEERQRKAYASRRPLVELHEKIEKKQTKIAQMETSIADFLSQYHKKTDSEFFVEQLYELSHDMDEYERLQQKESAIEQQKEKQSELRQQVEEFAETYHLKFGEDLAAELSDIQTKAAEFRIAKQNYDQAVWKKEQFEATNDIEKLKEEREERYTIDELNSAIHQLDAAIDEVRSCIEQYNRQMDELQELLDQRDEREQELRNTRMIQEEEIHKYDIMECAQEYLTRAKEQFTARYMAPVSNAFEKYYDLMWRQAPKEWQIDANIRLQVKEQGELRQTRSLSSGYQDLIGICMRLALVDAMYKEEKPFLILDDPFVNQDEEHNACGLRMLEETADEYQIIYFTCHRSRVPEITGERNVVPEME